MPKKGNAMARATRAKISATRMGRPIPLATRAKISATRKEQQQIKRDIAAQKAFQAGVLKTVTIPSSATRGEYKVGYGKPPREHRWKPGQSGNPEGRPKEEKPAIEPEMIKVWCGTAQKAAEEARSAAKEAHASASESAASEVRSAAYAAARSVELRGEIKEKVEAINAPLRIRWVRIFWRHLNAPISGIETRLAVWLWFVWFILYLITWIPLVDI